METRHGAVAIIPSCDLDRSETFYGRLGFRRPAGERMDWESAYRILYDAQGASVHLAKGGAGLLNPEANTAALYLYSEQVDELASEFGTAILERSKRPEHKPWGMYEFAVSDPDGALIRIGWPTRLRS